MTTPRYTYAELRTHMSSALHRFGHADLVRHKTFHRAEDDSIVGGRATLRSGDGKTLQLRFERSSIGTERITEAEFEAGDGRQFRWSREDAYVGQMQDLSEWFGQELYMLACRYHLFDSPVGHIGRLNPLPRRR